ncbi:MAG: T9SS type A sorting domain-containing protein [candidate division Zixibacteria bacterium]|nr:T9SS type A sorting domain-containing protein [candidate division Zixibacteria bacterium]
MRCHEARRRIVEAYGSQSGNRQDEGLHEHLRQCCDCAAYARAELMLQRDLKLVTIRDDADEIPFNLLRTRVEARACLSAQPSKEKHLMNTLTNQLKGRPRLGISLAMAVAVLAFVTLVPFKFERTVGYDVAIAGVDKKLAMDSQKVSELLAALGLDDATFEVGDCEATCQLNISELKSQEDVQVVVAAFNQLGHCELKNVSEICGEDPSSLLDHVKRMVFVKRAGGADSCAINAVVIKKLESLTGDSTGAFSIWVSGDANCETEMDITFLDSTCLPGGALPPGCQSLTAEMNQAPDGTGEVVVTTADGVEHRIDLNDESAAEQLKELGLDVDILGSGEPGQRDMCIKKTVCLTPGTADEGDAAAKETTETELPEGYSLSQNYPNPFNPTTDIDFSLPVAQHVSLTIFDIQGREVRTLVDKRMGAGQHTVEWDGTTDAGDQVASGVYLYRLTAGDVSKTKKMTFLK